MFAIYITIGLLAVIIVTFAQYKVQSAYKEYSAILSGSEYTGASLARKILRDNDINNISVNQISGVMSDHYYHRKKQLNLSNDVYGDSSIAALAIAAHEAGHAIQHKTGYAGIKIRNIIVPITNLVSKLFIPLIIVGSLFYGVGGLLDVAEWFYLASAGLLGLSVLVNLVTLPVEFDASRRAIKCLENGVLYGEELEYAKKMLTAAALTYVAALASSILYMLRFLLIIASRRD